MQDCCLKKRPCSFLSISFCLFVLLFFFAFKAEGKRYTLFSRGKTSYSIVIGNSASTSEMEAAKELQEYLFQISDIRFPILNEGVTGKRIIIGYNDEAANNNPSRVPFPPQDESFSIFSVKGDIFIYGGSLRGTLYGVYDFLEKEFSCKWYTKDISVIPHKRKWSFKSIDRTVHPAFKIRTVYYRSLLDQQWVKHSRNSGRELYWGTHTMGLLVPADKFFAKHPEYFSLWKGERKSDAQLCLSNPALVKICADALKEVIRDNPNYLVYDLSQNDNQYPCQCNRCQAIVKEEGSESGPIIRFVNQVARIIKEEYPDKYLGTFAYTYSRQAPRKVKPDDNVIIRLCDGECCFSHTIEECEVNRRFFNDLKEWSAISSNLMVWDYVAPVYEYLVPFPNLAVLQPNIQLFKRYGAIGAFEQGSYTSWLSDLSDLKSYLLTQLLMDDNADVNALTNDFLKNVYGKSAPYIKQYINYLNSLVTPNFHLAKYNHFDDAIYSPEMIAYCCNLFDKAEKVAENEIIRDRVRVVRVPIDYLYIRNYPQKASQDGTITRFKEFAGRMKITWAYRKKRFTEMYDDLKIKE